MNIIEAFDGACGGATELVLGAFKDVLSPSMSRYHSEINIKLIARLKRPVEESHGCT
jgi:hypothetical protein